MQELSIRKMTGSDLPSLMRLKRAAGWNQLEEDWKLLMKLAPSGCFVAEKESRVVASATAVPYEDRVGWIGMVIVDPEYRRQGIASAMMNEAIRFLETHPCASLKLDATDQGAAVYGRIGFQEEYGVERWIRGPAEGPIEFTEAEGCSIRPLSPSSEFDPDLEAFGADRRPLLRLYCDRSSQVCLGAFREEKLVGYCLGRPGSGAFQIGPLVAESREVARELMGAGLKAVKGHPLIADIHTWDPEPTRLLRSFGFTRSRVLKRMFRGENRYPGRPEEIFLLAGFEFG